MENRNTLIPGFCEGGLGTQLVHVNGHVNCNVLVGYKAVYRVSFAMSMFFLVFSLLMIGVKTSKDPRAAVHNGFWFFKILAIVGIMVGAFYIPEGPFTNGRYDNFFILIHCVFGEFVMTSLLVFLTAVLV